MTNIEKIPIEELYADRRTCRVDMFWLELALNLGVTYSGADNKERLDGNRQIVAKINKELERRKSEDS